MVGAAGTQRGALRRLGSRAVGARRALEVAVAEVGAGRTGNRGAAAEEEEAEAGTRDRAAPRRAVPWLRSIPARA